MSVSWKIVQTADKGRCMQARQAIKTGDRVIVDKPAAAWPRREPDQLTALLQAFDAAKQDQKDAIMTLTSEISYPNAELDELIQSWRQMLMELPAKTRKGRTIEELMGLVLRTHFNAHEAEDTINLHPVGAIVNHSCSPNMLYRFRDNDLEFIALRDIAEDEELTASYLNATDMIHGKAVRRQLLSVSKGFWCQCSRCSAPYDDARVWTCKACRKSTLRLYEPEGKHLYMKCEACGHKLNQQEAQAERKPAEHLLEFGGPVDPRHAKTAKVVQTLFHKAQLFSYNHYATQVCRIDVLEAGSKTVGTAIYKAEAFNLASWLASFAEKNPILCTSLVVGALSGVFDHSTSRVASGLAVDKVIDTIRIIRPIAVLRQGETSAFIRALDQVLKVHKRDCWSTTCAKPFAEGKRLFCSACAAAWYCSPACQKEDWAKHKATCKINRKERDAIAAHEALYSVPVPSP